MIDSIMIVFRLFWIHTSHDSNSINLFLHFFLIIFYFSLLLLFIFVLFTLVDIIKPKPLPRNILNGNSNHTNNNVTSSGVSMDPSVQKSTNATMSVTSSNNENRSCIGSTVSTSPSKTESLIQRFSFSHSTNGKSPPEVLKRISGKQIATIFEVRNTLLI